MTTPTKVLTTTRLIPAAQLPEGTVDGLKVPTVDSGGGEGHVTTDQIIAAARSAAVTAVDDDIQTALSNASAASQTASSANTKADTAISNAASADGKAEAAQDAATALEQAAIDPENSVGVVESGQRLLRTALAGGGSEDLNMTGAFSGLQDAINFTDENDQTIASAPKTIKIVGAGVTSTYDAQNDVLTLEITGGGSAQARANGTFSDVDISSYSGLVGWWDVSDASTVTESGGAVSELADKSSGGNDFVQATGGNQPALLSADQNGLATLDFDGSTTFMTANGAGDVLDGNDAAFTIHAVMGADEVDATMVGFGFGSTANTTVGLYLGSGSTGDGVLRFNKRSGGSEDVDTPVENDGKLHCVTVSHSGTATDIWVDGHRIATTVAQDTNSIACDLLTLGAWTRSNGTSSYFEGRFGEMAVFTGQQSDADIKAIQGHLLKKWFAMVPDIDFIFALGQSNMLGRAGAGYAADLPGNATGTGLKWREGDDTFIPIRDPIGEQSPDGGCLYAFSNQWRAETGRSTYIVQRAIGSTSLLEAAGGTNGYWEYDASGSLYPAAFAEANTALADLAANSAFTLNQIIVLWAQGETDATKLDAATAGVSAAAYQAELEALFTALQSDLTSAPDLFFVSELGVWDGAGDPESSYAAIRSAQSDACDAIDGAYLAYTGAKDFATASKMVDDDHYTQTGYNDMGAGLATGGAQYALDPLVA